MSNELDKLGRISRNAAGGVSGELLHRRIREVDPDKYYAAETKLAELRQEAMELITPVLRRLLVSYRESFAQAAVEAEARLEANRLPLRNGNSWVLHEDAVCRFSGAAEYGTQPRFGERAASLFAIAYRDATR